jgi:glycosyltransferase involved in cell wall biosynthesis
VKRVLVVSYDLEHIGGGSSVAAWVLQALSSRNEVSILTWSPGDLTIANRNFGTSLRGEDFRWFTVAPSLRRTLAPVPLPLAHLKSQLLYRKARQLNEAESFDVVFGVMNEIDVGTTALQYIHFPSAHWPRPQADLRWYHIEAINRCYRWVATRLSGHDPRRVAGNVTVANSDWTARCFERFYGVRPRTIYPPVPGGFPDVPFEARARGFNCLGRISPEKRLVEIIEILAAVRERGHDVNLQIIGSVDSPAYLRRVTAAAAPHRAWISFHHDLARDEMARVVVRNRYAIHAMLDEHFGIATAELQRAGCITFVPDSGGSLEIVGGDERIAYRSGEDAVEKIHRVLSDPALESALRRDVERRRAVFTEQRFVCEIAALVDSFGADAVPPSNSPNGERRI